MVDGYKKSNENKNLLILNLREQVLELERKVRFYVCFVIVLLFQVSFKPLPFINK